MKNYKIVVSDCHLSAGRIFEGRLNPYEDFHFDREMVEMFEYFSRGKYGTHPDGSPVEVELILAGDYLDFLNVPYHGEFEDVITEDVALYKAQAILAGHPDVMRTIKAFASLPGKKVTYLVGNHDADLFFSKVREFITKAWDPEGKYPSTKVELVADREFLSFENGILEIHHGNQFEAGSVLNFEKPLLESNWLAKPVLNIPWSSFYVLKIINRLKSDREFIDKVRPIKVFVLFGMILDPWFTIRFVCLSVFYFLKTRFIWSPTRRSRLKVTVGILKEETKLFLDLEAEARHELRQRPALQTIVFGHTHRPMDKLYPDGKQYINTGTWTRMLNLDWRGIGQTFIRTFAHIEIEDAKVRCELRQWDGEHKPHFQVLG